MSQTTWPGQQNNDNDNDKDKYILIDNTFKERSHKLMSSETFGQSYEDGGDKTIDQAPAGSKKSRNFAKITSQ